LNTARYRTMPERLSILLLLFVCLQPVNAQLKVKTLPDYVIEQFGQPPATPDGPLTKELKAALDTAFRFEDINGGWTRDQNVALDTIANSGDPRLAWLISDLMRFAGRGVTGRVGYKPDRD